MINPSWPGFVPAIHVFLIGCDEDVDARHKDGHDELHRLPRAILPGAQSQSFQFQGLSFHGVNICTRHCAIPFER